MVTPDNPLHPFIQDFEPSGNLKADIKRLLQQHHLERTYNHLANVAAKAKELSLQFSGNKKKTEVAAWLHDISAIIPDDQRIDVSRALGIDILPEEKALPMIIHQKLSVPIARDAFGIEDAEVLSAIECHTTLKANPSLTDKIVFLADKIAWDQPDLPPCLNDIMNALETSLEQAVLVYLEYLHKEVREKSGIIHPWAIDAIEYLS